MRRGIGRADVLVAVAVLAGAVVVAKLLLDAFRHKALVARDGTQLRQIHASLSTFAAEGDGAFPVVSREDPALNHTAGIYSMLVMANYFTPQILVSPLETRTYVRVKTDFEYVLHAPGDEVHFDPSFVMHVHDPSVGANASYAHLAAVGERRRLDVRARPAVPVIGSRWLAEPGRFVTAQHEVIQYAGNPVVVNRGPDGVFVRDLVYAADFEHARGSEAAGDAWLAIYIGATEFTVEEVFDPGVTPPGP